MKRPNGQTQILGLIGTTIHNSHSYRLHNYVIDKMNLNAVYLPLQSTQSNWDSLFELDNFLGANVTMPYKENLMDRMDSLTDRANQIGAINTIHKLDGKLVGDNTDAIGFLSAMDKYSIDWLQRPIYILGAGGAAKAVCYALNSLGVKTVHVWNRNTKRIQNLNTLLPNVLIWDNETPLPEDAIIIQCTPLGQNGEEPLKHQDLQSKQLLLDLIYKQTPLIKRMQNLGATAVDGMGMLIHQASHSFARWFECPPPIDMMTETSIHSPNTENPT